MKIVHKVQTKIKTKGRKTKANPHSSSLHIINDSSEAEKELSSENVRTDEPSRIFMISNND